MPKVTSYSNEPFEKTLRRFKKAVDKSNILKDLHKKEFYEKPSSIRKRTKAAAVKRAQKILQEHQLPNQNRKY